MSKLILSKEKREQLITVCEYYNIEMTKFETELNKLSHSDKKIVLLSLLDNKYDYDDDDAKDWEINGDFINYLRDNHHDILSEIFNAIQEGGDAIVSEDGMVYDEESIKLYK